MGLDYIKDALPEYAKDIKLNLSTLATEEGLTEQQRWGCFLSTAIATKNHDLIRHVAEEAASHLSADAQNAAKAAAVIMGMNNIYYRSVHIMGNHDYQKLPAKLRMTVIGNTGVDKVDFELWSFAVSAVNGCGMCLESHESHLAKAGMSREHVQVALRIAATINATAVALEAKAVLA